MVHLATKKFDIRKLALSYLVAATAVLSGCGGSSESEFEQIVRQSTELSAACFKIDGAVPIELAGKLTRRSGSSGAQGDEPRYVISRYILVLNQPTCFQGNDEWGNPIDQNPNTELAVFFGPHWNEADVIQYLDRNVTISFKNINVAPTYHWMTTFFGEVNNIKTM